tara:strand:- start:298 stop:579 length:282 start_codon:yes stop_codon:yes gene_type:complete
MKRIRVYNMTSPRGNKIANQFEIHTKDGVYFQSYSSIIAYKRYRDGQIFLDEYYWDYSATTGKYRNIFLGDYGIEETREKIASKEYKLKNLNK